MPVNISVGPPEVTINQGSTFMVTAPDGQILADSEQGVFADDTRFVSYYAVFANGEPWQLLTSAAISYYAARFHLTNPPFETEKGPVAGGALALSLGRSVADGIHEDIDITNYSRSPARFILEIALRSDFADLFEVKSHHFVRRGRVTTEWHDAARELETSYTNGDFTRRFIFRVHSASPVTLANGRISFEIALQPGGQWHSCCEYALARDGRVREPLRGCAHDEETELDTLHRRWLQEATALTSANEDLYRLYRQSVEDMGALRLHDHDLASDLWLPAAGVPWFVTMFGRDSLIASLQNMIVFPRFASGVLKKLAEYQATSIDEWRDAEPGKILHEIRFGELAHFKRVPHTPYYGTADATPLYLIVLHEGWKWMGQSGIAWDEYRDVAVRCLDWIDHYGDLDGDGFQEYRTRSSAGYENMGWKDAADAVVYPDGRQVKQPKALCELQGYVFDAWMRMAELFDAHGDAPRARELRRRAADLQDRFEERFWCDDIGAYAFALDPDKHPVRTIASNMGHCLWSGLIRPERAARVVERLLQPDMWSGWGIRTLSQQNPAYNPSSYQCGSVWPHDNGIIALGFKRYGFADAAARIARDISEAASYFVGYRLPELYAGLERLPGTFPVLYPGANVPQAWAAGSVFHLLQAILGLQADAPNGHLYVDPVLPRWLPEITLRGLRIGAAIVALRFWREGEQTRWESIRVDGQVEIEQRSWRPWMTPQREPSP